MEVVVKHNSISIHNVVHGVHGKGNVGLLKSTPCCRVDFTPWRTPCTANTTYKHRAAMEAKVTPSDASLCSWVTSSNDPIYNILYC